MCDYHGVCELHTGLEAAGDEGSPGLRARARNKGSCKIQSGLVWFAITQHKQMQKIDQKLPWFLSWFCVIWNSLCVSALLYEAGPKGITWTETSSYPSWFRAFPGDTSSIKVIMLFLCMLINRPSAAGTFIDTLHGAQIIFFVRRRFEVLP